jgi:hypothetical protein
MADKVEFYNAFKAQFYNAFKAQGIECDPPTDPTAVAKAA